MRKTPILPNTFWHSMHSIFPSGLSLPRFCPLISTAGSTATSLLLSWLGGAFLSFGVIFFWCSLSPPPSSSTPSMGASFSPRGMPWTTSATGAVSGVVVGPSSSVSSSPETRQNRWKIRRRSGGRISETTIGTLLSEKVSITWFTLD